MELFLRGRSVILLLVVEAFELWLLLELLVEVLLSDVFGVLLLSVVLDSSVGGM